MLCRNVYVFEEVSATTRRLVPKQGSVTTRSYFEVGRTAVLFEGCLSGPSVFSYNRTTYLDRGPFVYFSITPCMTNARNWKQTRLINNWIS